MTHAIVRFDKPQFTDVDALTRSGVCASDLDNGWVAQLLTQSSTTGQGEVWTATVPTSANSGLKNLWMAASPEVIEVIAANGNVYKGIDSDPANFYSVAGEIIDFVRLEPGDLVTLTADALTVGDPLASTYAVAHDSSWKLYWSTTNPATGLTLKYLATTFISKGTAGAISETQQVVAYKFQVYATA